MPTSEPTLTPEQVAPLKQLADAFGKVVRLTDYIHSDDNDDDGYPLCYFCNEPPEEDGGDDRHTPECCWNRAVLALKAYQEASK